LAQSGLPIDILFRLTVQSLNGLQSNASLETGVSSNAAGFYRAIQALRQLQKTGALSISVERSKDRNHVTVSFADDIGPAASLHEVRQLLHLAPIGAQIEVPAAAVTEGRTFPTIVDFPNAARSAIVVQNGKQRPDNSFAAVQYRNVWYWIADDHAASNVALTVVEILEALAQSSSSSQAPLVTIPTN
jgi:hypothetical protein